MAVLDQVRGQRAPLFDRFHANGFGTQGAGVLLTWHAARQQGDERVVSPLERSIEQELARLLNTRCAWPREEAVKWERSVVDYGLPDCTALYTANLADQQRLAAMVRDTIAAFEPRLREVQVALVRIPNSRHGLRVSISGAVLVGGRLEPVRFDINTNDEKAHPITRGEGQ